MVDYMTVPAASLSGPERRLIRDMAEMAAGIFVCSSLEIVNIGVGLGGTLWCLRAGAPTAHIIGIDIDPDSTPGDWEFHHADSRRFHAQVPAPVHLLLVDGDHDYYGIKADILNWTPKVPRFGVVIFHDYERTAAEPWTAGVKKAVDELIDSKTWQVLGAADSVKVFQRR